MSYTSWHVGMKVVCLKGVNPAVRGSISHCGGGDRVGTAKNANYPEQGAVYTLRHISVVSSEVLVLLQEVRNDHLTRFIRNGVEPGFNAKYFKPVQVRKTDISIFTALLNPSDTEKLRELEAEMQAR